MLADINFTDLAEYHRGAGTTGTMALTYKRNTDLYGVARMEGMKIVAFEEKLGDAGQHGLINAGIYFFEPAIFDMITPDTLSLETEVLPQLARAGQLAGYPFQSRWFDLSLPASRSKAETDWSV
jgi:NDP-sugar pyrophosphorylase family protein